MTPNSGPLVTIPETVTVAPAPRRRAAAISACAEAKRGIKIPIK